MKNPILLFVSKLVASLFLFASVFYLTGLTDVYASFFQKTNTAKFQWMQKGLLFDNFAGADAMGNDTMVRLELDNRPRSNTRMNSQKFSSRLYIMLLGLFIATPGIFKNGRGKRILFGLFLIFLYIQAKLLISIWTYASLQAWPLLENIPSWLQSLLPHFYRFFVMSSSFNMLVLFAIWTLFCFDLIMNTFWTKAA